MRCRLRLLSEFTEVDSLPCSGLNLPLVMGMVNDHPPCSIWHEPTYPSVLHPGAGILGRHQPVFRRYPSSHVATSGQVLVQRQSTTGMSYKRFQNPCLRQRWQVPHHLVGYEVKA